jgi:STE24 endopeptidase
MTGLPASGATSDRSELEHVVSRHYDLDFLERSRDYHRVRFILFFVQIGVTLTVAGLMAAGPLGRWGQEALSAAGGHPWLARLLLLSIVYGGLALLRLPFSAIRFVHAHNYGMRHDSWTSFLLDWAKAVGIGWIMVMVAGLLVLWLFAAFPRWWWVAGTALVAVLAAGYVTIAPLIIDPLFNRFEKLDDPELEGRLLDLSGEGGIEVREILISDASRRSRAVNAYFTGFGRTQRIVLYDTLVDKFDHDEIAIVLAHEVGHWKHRDIYKGLALGILGTLIGFLIAQGILGGWANSGVRELSGRGDPGLVIPAYALYILLTFVALVPSNWVSRRMESEADRTSLALTRDPDTFISTETRLARENLSNVLPPAWVEFTLYTHPSNARRILMAERFK